MGLQHCWDIKKCGRQKGSDKVAELGECVVSKTDFSHFCWAVAGTLCGGVVQGTAAEKEGNCMLCDVYKMYNPMHGTKKDEVMAEHPEEYQRYLDLMRTKTKKETALAS